MDLEQDSASHPFLAWTQVLARTQTSPLPFLTPLLGVLYGIAQTFTSSEAAQLYLHHFLKARKKIRGRNRLARQNVPLLISVKREAAVQKSLPLCTLTSARDHPASILCRDTDIQGCLLYSWIFILGLSRAWNSHRLCLGQAIRSHTEFRSLILISGLPVCSCLFSRIQLLEVSREDEVTKAVLGAHRM